MDVEYLMEIRQPFKAEGCELGTQEGRGNGVSNYEVSEVGEGLVVEDWSRIHPARAQEGLIHREVEVGVPDAESGSLVGTLVTIDTGVSLNPGELEQGVVTS